MMVKKLLLAAASALLCTAAFADRTDKSGQWIVRYRGDHVTVVKCLITDQADIAVPASIDGLAVTRIGENAFSKVADTVENVTLPESVTELDDGAFSYCAKLRSVAIPAGVTSIPAYAFYKCAALESVAIPEGVTSIGGSAFASCYELASVSLPSTLRYIGRAAFDSCGKLREAAIPVSVRFIDETAFDGTALDEVHIARPTHIDYYAFDGNTLLYVFKGSQADEAVKERSRYDYIYEDEGGEGDLPEYDDYDEYERDDDDDGYYADDEDGYGDDDDEDDAPPVTEEQLAGMVEAIVARENTGAFADDQLGSDGENDVYHVNFAHCSAGVDVAGDFPYIYYLLEGNGGDVPNLLYVVYGRGTSSNTFLFGLAGSSLSDSDEDDIRDADNLSELYGTIQNYTISYRATVEIGGEEFEVYCTDIDED